jgi:integrase
MLEQDLTQAYRLSLVDKSPNTVRLYCASVAAFLRGLPAPDLTHVTVVAIRSYLENLADHAAPNTVAVHLKGLRSFCQWAQREVELDPSVFDNMPRSWKTPHTVPITATAEEIKSLVMATADKPRHRAIICLAGHAGLRSNEIRQLKWADVDLRKGNLNILGKGRNLREVPILTMELYEALRGLPKKYELVLPGQSGRAMRSRALIHMIHEACDWAGITRLTESTDRVCHALRHGFASLLASKGVPVSHIQYMLGHSSLLLTELYLTSLRGPEPARAAVMAAGVFA